MSTSSRKLDHIRICLEEQVESGTSPFADIQILHRALPEIDLHDIDTSTTLFGRRLSLPLIICGMTGGHRETGGINRNLATAAQAMGISMAVGSQRAALENPELEDTFSVVRDAAPDIPVIGNIGAVQLCREGPEIIERVAEMIGADAVAVHLNFLQESIQPEGETHARGVIEALRSVAGGRIPVLVKETGAGICREDASLILGSGIRTIDVAGLGGTNWSSVESFRAEDLASRQRGRLFSSWGIPTTASIVECASTGAEVIASGGVRSGLDVAKGITLGAKLAGVALPLLAPASRSANDVIEVLEGYARDLRTCMFLTGNTDIPGLSRSPVLITGHTREILELRGFNTTAFAAAREMFR